MKPTLEQQRDDWAAKYFRAKPRSKVRDIAHRKASEIVLKALRANNRAERKRAA
jgi:hypothetical protein